MFLVDRNQQRRRLLEAALELEDAEADDGAEPETETDASDRVIMMSPKAARRFRIRPND